MSRLSLIPACLLCLILSVSPEAVFGQKTRDIPGVQQTLVEFFKGLNEGDTTLMSGIMGENLALTTITERRGVFSQREVLRKPFLEAVSKPREQAWQEVIKNVEVTMDGGLAHAWMDYSFYLGETLHHCGANSFTLFYDGRKWVIIHIVDTQQRLNCQ